MSGYWLHSKQETGFFGLTTTYELCLWFAKAATVSYFPRAKLKDAEASYKLAASPGLSSKCVSRIFFVLTA